MNFLHLEIENEISNLNVSISGGTCASALIFGSNSVPSFSIQNNIGRLEFLDNITDFSDNYGSTKQISNNAYSTSKAGSSYNFISIICPFYSKV